MLSLLLLFVLGANGRRTDYPPEILGNQIKSLPGLNQSTFNKYTMFGSYIDGKYALSITFYGSFMHNVNTKVNFNIM